MTASDARLFIQELKILCDKFESLCNCRIDLNITEKRSGIKNLKFIVIDSLSLKIDN